MPKEGSDTPYIEVDGSVAAYGGKRAGFIVKRPCPDCGRITVYSDAHDALFCPACNRWLESACSDPSCAFCSARPHHPLDAGVEIDTRQEELRREHDRRKARRQVAFAKGLARRVRRRP
jgi:ribosomal protein S27E